MQWNFSFAMEARRNTQSSASTAADDAMAHESMVHLVPVVGADGLLIEQRVVGSANHNNRTAGSDSHNNENNGRETKQQRTGEEGDDESYIPPSLKQMLLIKD